MTSLLFTHMTAVLRNDSDSLRRAWHPVLPATLLHDLPVRVELLGQAWVVARLDGAIRAFPDKCPHRNARLSNGSIVNEQLQCPYHGWKFTGEGRCALVPALGEGSAVPPMAHLLPAAHVAERYGMVWVAPDEPVCDILSISQWSDADITPVWLPAVDMAATAAQFMDNFLDFSHFPFVHAATFGSSEDELIMPYEVEPFHDGWGFLVNYPHTVNNYEDPKVATSEHPLAQPRIMRYEYVAPFMCSLRLELPLTNVVSTIVSFLQPMTADSTRLYTVILRDDCADPEVREATVQYELSVLQEDLRVIEHLWNNEIPLGRGQAHSRSDRNTVEFRRIMSRLLALDTPTTI